VLIVHATTSISQLSLAIVKPVWFDILLLLSLKLAINTNAVVHCPYNVNFKFCYGTACHRVLSAEDVMFVVFHDCQL